MMVIRLGARDDGSVLPLPRILAGAARDTGGDMPNEQHPSAVYHLGESSQIPSGRLVHVEDRDGATADIFLHRLHARRQLVREFNWLTRHQVGDGLWRQRWTDEGRMQQPIEGLGIAESRWEIVPALEMPRDRTVFPTEEDGVCVWNIRSGYCTGALRNEMNGMLERIAGDGLWLQAWYEHKTWPGIALSPTPLRVPPAILLAV
jgi:hypothetical protein